MTSIKINGSVYPADVSGIVQDREWGNRESKSITLEMAYAQAISLFVDGVEWSILYQPEGVDGEGAPFPVEEYDNSEYAVAGDLTDHRDGTVTVKMGKYTNEELLLMEVLG